MKSQHYLGKLNKLRKSGGIVHNRAILAVAFALFAALLFMSYRSLPELNIRWVWFIPTVAAIIATIILSGIEYQLSGRILAHRIPFPEALRISLLSSAANMLPLPGSVILRTESLKRKGSSYLQALSSTAATGVGWVGTAAVMAATLVLSEQDSAFGWILAIGGAGALLAMVLLLRRSTAAAFSFAIQVIAVEAVLVVLTAVRLAGVLNAIGVGVSATQAVALSLSDALAAAVGVFPGGLGLREAMAGGLSVLIDLPPAAGVLAAALDRVAALLILSLAAALVIMQRARKTANG
ncbi:MAG: hypothetical protein ACYTAS_10615 [Planctomycetota bacterium]|jgi:hypothetical protein